MPKTKAEFNIPLRCSLCPKHPQFSDISHLLTHISSKSHLSHRFKLQIRAQSEIASKEQLDDFDHWYTHNNLDVMLSERMAAKELKKTTKERKSRLSSAPPKQEKRELTDDPSLADTPRFRAPVTRMHLWPTANSTSQSSNSMDGEWEPSPIYATPSARRKIPNFSLEITPGSKIDPKLGALVTPWKGDNENGDKWEGKLSDSIKLKGITWPGMDLFDSATPEMKRMRNQRKDTSVLEHMKATSAEITTDEVVYNLDGSISHTRDIFGPLSCETTPNKDPTPKKRKPRKQVLADLDVDAPHNRASRSKKAVPLAGFYREDTSPQPSRARHNGLSYKAPPTLNPLAGFARRYTDEDEEFNMTMADLGSIGGVKKRSFSIFQDIPEVSPVRTESPLEEPRFDFPHSLLPLPPYSNKSPTNLLSPTPVVKPTSMRIFGKENGQPEHPSHVQIRRTMTTSHIYPPQVFYDPMFSNPLLNLYHQSPYRRNTPYGLQSNFQDNKSPEGYASTFQGAFKSVNPISRGSPTKPASGAGNKNNGGRTSKSISAFVPPSGGKNMHGSTTHASRSGSGHGAGSGSSSSMYHGNTDNTSRPGTGHGAPLNSNALFRGN